MTHAVILPGLDGTGELLEDFSAALGRHLQTRVITYPTHEELGYPELTEQVRASLPENEPYILIGESFSGPIALSIAASKPADLLGVVLCCSFACNPHPELVWLLPAAKLLPPRRLPRWMLLWLCLGRWTTPASSKTLEGCLASVSPKVLQTRLVAAAGVDVTGLVSQISVPVLYLQASEDRLVPHSAAALLRQKLPKMRVVELQGPHFLLQAAPSAAAEEVREFFGT